MFDSINSQSILDFDVKIFLHFLNQCGNVDIKSIENIHSNLVLNEIKTNSIIGLSEARNLLIDYISPKKESIIGFPDDDCWYPEKFFFQLLSKKKLPVIMTNVFDPISINRYGTRSYKSKYNLSFLSSLKNAISVNIFLDFDCISGIKFNENFGIGTVYGSGEESIFISQVVKKGIKTQYEGSLLVYHELDPFISCEDTGYYNKIYNYSYGYSKACLYIYKHYNYKALFLLIRQIFLVLLLIIISNKTKKKAYIQRFKGFFGVCKN